MSDSSVSGATQPGGEAESLEQRVAVAIEDGLGEEDWCSASVEALTPSVVALVREQIARDIEAEGIPNARNVGSDAEHLNDGLRLAANIARNGAWS